MKTEQEVLKALNDFIEIEGWRKDFLAKRMKIEFKEFEQILLGKNVDIIEFSKKLAELRGFDSSFFLNDEVDVYNKSKKLGMILMGFKLEDYVPNKNVEQVRKELKDLEELNALIYSKKEELEALESQLKLKESKIEKLL